MTPPAAPTWRAGLPLAVIDESRVWRQLADGPLAGRLGEQASTIAAYAFTEMLNNAIEHSGGTTATATLWLSPEDARFEILDDGVGMTVTTHHPGPGIVVTSKAVDAFTLESGGLTWTIDNLRSDQSVGSSALATGTRAAWQVARATTRRLADVFAAFSDDEHEFTRTTTVVRLFGLGVSFVSRSEGRRLARGLERFRHVELDFTGVDSVGQGFVDEVLRVWAAAHPDTTLTPTGMNGAVAFMVRRGLPTGRA